MRNSQDLSGAGVCARYAFAPNLYHYCGPDTGGELGEYVKANLADGKLIEYLTKFETLYPYLKAIAVANDIPDPLDKRVVEAYWVGNELLEQVSKKAMYAALVEGQRLPKRLPKKGMRGLLPKIDQQARLHHSFHVLNVFIRTGHRMVAETVETMEECRISWGEVISNFQFSILNQFSNVKFSINSQKLIYKEGKLKLEPSVREVVVVQEALSENIRPGDWVSVHWGIVCDQLNEKQVKQLEKYTLHHLRLANETI